MDEKYEEIEDSLEDLLIFPTRKGLRQSMEMIEAYFAIEVEIMDRRQLREGHDQKQHHRRSTIEEEQQTILNIAKSELNERKQKHASACESGWIQAPKGIDKGIDKNVAARLASAFARHADCFTDIRADGKK